MVGPPRVAARFLAEMNVLFTFAKVAEKQKSRSSRRMVSRSRLMLSRIRDKLNNCRQVNKSSTRWASEFRGRGTSLGYQYGTSQFSTNSSPWRFHSESAGRHT